VGLAKCNPNKTLAADFAGNRLLARAGIVWTLADLSPTSAKGFSTAKPPAELAHARQALDAAVAFSDHKRKLSPVEFEQVSTTLMLAARSLPLGDTLLRPQLEKLVGREEAKSVPSAGEPIGKDRLLARLAMALEAGRLQQVRPAQVTAHPAAAQFPGVVPPGAARVTERVLVQTSQWRWGWFGTGLYAPPGETITVHVPAVAAGRGLSIVIGPHTPRVVESGQAAALSGDLLPVADYTVRHQSSQRVWRSHLHFSAAGQRSGRFHGDDHGRSAGTTIRSG
jgi:hypothetical protein